MVTYNLDIVGVWNRLNRYIIEVQKSQSANLSLTVDADMIRVRSYLSTIRFLIQHILDVPTLDLPETNPQEHTLRAAPELADIENENCAHIALLLATLRDELVMSQSSRMSTGLVSFDVNRLLAGITKAENYMSNFVAEATPVDLPESSPRAATQGKGLNSSI